MKSNLLSASSSSSSFDSMEEGDIDIKLIKSPSSKNSPENNGEDEECDIQYSQQSGQHQSIYKRGTQSSNQLSNNKGKATLPFKDSDEQVVASFSDLIQGLQNAKESIIKEAAYTSSKQDVFINKDNLEVKKNINKEQNNEEFKNKQFKSCNYDKNQLENEELNEDLIIKGQNNSKKSSAKCNFFYKQATLVPQFKEIELSFIENEDLVEKQSSLNKDKKKIFGTSSKFKFEKIEEFQKAKMDDNEKNINFKSQFEKKQPQEEGSNQDKKQNDLLTKKQLKSQIIDNETKYQNQEDNSPNLLHAKISSVNIAKNTP